MASNEQSTRPADGPRGPAMVALGVALIALGFSIAAFVRSGRPAQSGPPVVAPGPNGSATTLPGSPAIVPRVKTPAVPAGTTPADAPRIVLDRMIHDFGLMRPRTSGTTTFTIRNEGTSVLILQQPETSCGCTVASLSSRTIQPGALARLDIRFDAGAGNPNRAVTKTVSIASNDPKQPMVTLQIRADVKPIYVIEPRYVNFGAVMRGAEARRMVRVRSTDGKPITLKSVTIDKPVFVLENVKLNVPATRHSFAITVKPGLPARYVSGTLRVATDRDGGRPAAATVSLQVRGRVQLLPMKHTWRVMQGRRTYVRTQMVIGMPNEPLDIKSVTVSGGPFKTELIQVIEGKRYQIKITLDLTGDDRKMIYSEKLIIETNYEDEKVVKVPLNVRVLPAPVRRPTPRIGKRLAPPRPQRGAAPRKSPPPQKP